LKILPKIVFRRFKDFAPKTFEMPNNLSYRTIIDDIINTYYLFCTVALADPVLLVNSRINYKKDRRQAVSCEGSSKNMTVSDRGPWAP
jgi:hypothetical protein